MENIAFLIRSVPTGCRIESLSGVFYYHALPWNQIPYNTANVTFRISIGTIPVITLKPETYF